MKKDKSIKSPGYHSGLFSKEEGRMEDVINKIRQARTTLEAFGPLREFMDKVRCKKTVTWEEYFKK